MSSAKKNKSLSGKQLAGLVVGGAALLGFTLGGILWMLALRDPAKMAAFQTAVESLGPGGWFILLAIQFVQIVVAFIPGGPIQIVSGALYGPLGGLSVCLIGTVLATFAIFLLVQRFGRRIISLFVDEKDILQYDFLQDAHKLERLVFLLYLIPGTPKDALTYMFALTDIPIRRFTALSTCARIPAMLTSVFAGDSIIQGKWGKAGVLFAVLTCISLGGLLLHKKIMAFYHRRRPEG